MIFFNPWNIFLLRAYLVKLCSLILQLWELILWYSDSSDYLVGANQSDESYLAICV